MLNLKEHSDDDINNWLSYMSSKFGFPIRRIASDHWQLDMRNTVAAYTIDIIDQGEWITYGVPLVADVEGKERDKFYGALLDLNAKLNGIHLGREDNRFVLVREESKERLNPLSLGESIALIDNAHQIVYTEIIKEIKRLDLKFIK